MSNKGQQKSRFTDVPVHDNPAIAIIEPTQSSYNPNSSPIERKMEQILYTIDKSASW